MKKTEMDDELRPEYDLKKLRVRRLGPGRKSFGGFCSQAGAGRGRSLSGCGVSERSSTISNKDNERKQAGSECF